MLSGTELNNSPCTAKYQPRKCIVLPESPLQTLPFTVTEVWCCNLFGLSPHPAAVNHTFRRCQCNRVEGGTPARQQHKHGVCVSIHHASLPLVICLYHTYGILQSLSCRLHSVHTVSKQHINTSITSMSSTSICVILLQHVHSTQPPILLQANVTWTRWWEHQASDSSWDGQQS